MGELTQVEKEAADWLAQNWESAVRGASFTVQLRERFELPFASSMRVVGEVRRRLGK